MKRIKQGWFSGYGKITGGYEYWCQMGKPSDPVRFVGQCLQDFHVTLAESIIRMSMNEKVLKKWNRYCRNFSSYRTCKHGLKLLQAQKRRERFVNKVKKMFGRV